MLTETTVEFLRAQRHDPSAERRTCMLPLAGIYWSDEIPDPDALTDLPDNASDQVFRLMGIRMQKWNAKRISDDDEAFWNEALAEAPDNPIFKRLTLSGEDRAAQLDVEHSVLEVFETLIEDADDFKIDKDGRFSLVFDLEKDKRKSIWQRLATWWSNKPS